MRRLPQFQSLGELQYEDKRTLRKLDRSSGNDANYIIRTLIERRFEGSDAPEDGVMRIPFLAEEEVRNIPENGSRDLQGGKKRRIIQSTENLAWLMYLHHP